MTNWPQHTHVVIKHPDGITTRTIKTGVLYGRPLTLDEELLLAMLAACTDKDAEIAALKAIVASYIAYDEADHNDTVRLMLDYADMLAESRAAMSQAVQP